MKFTCTVEINRELDRVIELYQDRNHLREWQDGFVSVEDVSGIPGEPGSKSKFVYKGGGKEFDLIETIIVNDLPREFNGLYEAKAMVNTMKTRFFKISSDKTRLESEIEYTAFNGIIPKMMSWLFPGLFKKQTQKWLDQFKDFVERAQESI